MDVTLACDGVQLKAHKMVLSACSPYFQSMLYSTPDRHPIVFLRDVRYHEMKALLEFMYRGEVSVDQDNLTSLLKVAEGLKIKGLAEVSDGNGANATPSSSSTAATTPVPPTSGVSTHPMLQPPSFVGFPGILSPQSSAQSEQNGSSNKRQLSPPPAPSAAPYLGPKRKRGRPRRLSGSEAVPLASGLTENTNSLHDRESKVAKVRLYFNVLLFGTLAKDRENSFYFKQLHKKYCLECLLNKVILLQTHRDSTDAPTSESRPLEMFEADSIEGRSSG